MKTNRNITQVIATVIITATLFSSCTKDNTSPESAWPVVESYLQPGLPASVKLTKQLPVNETDSGNYAIINATVKIAFLGKVYELQHTTGGVYVNAQMPIVEKGSYALSVSYNGLVTSATTTIPFKPKNVHQSATNILPVFSTMPVEMMNITWDNVTNDYYFVHVKALDLTAPLTNNNFGPSGFDAVVDQSSQRIIYNRSFHYYGRHAILLYHVQSDYASFYNASTTSSLNATGVPTNLSNGYGIFTGVILADSLFVTVN
jgi:hypothetical protein